MKKVYILAAVVLILLSLQTTNAWSGNYSGFITSMLSGYLDDGGSPRECLLIMIDTHPAWFGLSFDHPSYDEIRIMVFTAHITGRRLNIYTTDNMAACGYEEINFVGFF